MKTLLCTAAALATTSLANSALADSELDLLRDRIKQQEATIAELKAKLSQYETIPAPQSIAPPKIEIPEPSIDIPAPAVETAAEVASPTAIAEKQEAEATEEPAPAKAMIVEAAPAFYTVESGDHLTKIARKHNTSIAKLLELNPGINPNALRIGQRVIVPASETDAPALASTTAPEANASAAEPSEQKPAPRAAIVVEEAPSDRIPYRVQQGDTMFNLSRKHGTTVAAIQAVNPGLDPRKMWAGRQMYLPAPKKSSTAATAAPAPKPEPTPKPEPAATAPTTEPVAKAAEPEIPEPAPAPEPTAAPPAPEPVTETASTTATLSGKISTVTVDEQITFGDFAAKHNSTVDKINILNGLTLNSDTVLAVGSELYVPQ